MKTRNGFISNSSTTSFMVCYIEGVLGTKRKNSKVILKKKEIELLKKFGFKEIESNSPFNYGAYDFDNYKKISKENKKFFGLDLAYFVTCNEDEVFYFLLKNNIPFTSSEHYGDYFVFYEKDSRYFYRILNVGRHVFTAMKCLDLKSSQIKKKYEDKWLEKIPVKKWLKEHK